MIIRKDEDVLLIMNTRNVVVSAKEDIDIGDGLRHGFMQFDDKPYLIESIDLHPHSTYKFCIKLKEVDCNYYIDHNKQLVKEVF